MNTNEIYQIKEIKNIITKYKKKFEYLEYLENIKQHKKKFKNTLNYIKNIRSEFIKQSEYKRCTSIYSINNWNIRYYDWNYGLHIVKYISYNYTSITNVYDKNQSYKYEKY